MTEIWRPVPSYEGLYDVSNWGRVKSLDRWVEYSNGKRRFYPGQILKLLEGSKGYLQVALSKNSKVWRVDVHKLVLLAFVGPRPSSKHDACHGSKGRRCNHLFNLEWGLRKGKNNRTDKLRDGTLPIGEKHHNTKLTATDVYNIRAAAACGEFQKDIAKRYGCSRSAIGMIVQRKSWKYT